MQRIARLTKRPNPKSQQKTTSEQQYQALIQQQQAKLQELRTLEEKIREQQRLIADKIAELNRREQDLQAREKSLLQKAPPTNTVAVVIGIEYVAHAQQGRAERLPGCHSDAFVMQEILKSKFGVAPANIAMLSDASSVYTQPTKANILEAFKRVADRARGGDVSRVVVYYAGHGTQATDSNGDEADRRDECMVPADYLDAGFITDDELASALLAALPASVTCTLISDCCNSGTMYDMPFVYNVDSQQMSRLPDRAAPTAANVTVLSGCRDEQTSASAYNLERNVGWRGALTVALENAWTQHGYGATAGQVVESCRSFLSTRKFTQVPQLCSSRNIQPFTDKFM